MQASAFEGNADPATKTTFSFEYPAASSSSTTRKMFSVASALSFERMRR